MLLMVLTGWLERREREALAYLIEENRLLRRQLGGRRLRLAAFASEYGLATLVGVKTAGRLVAASSFKVGFGYRVALPVAAYFSWQGNNLEGRGVLPDIEERLSPEALWNGKDNQLERAQRSFAALATSQATA